MTTHWLKTIVLLYLVTSALGDQCSAQVLGDECSWQRQATFAWREHRIDHDALIATGVPVFGFQRVTVRDTDGTIVLRRVHTPRGWHGELPTLARNDANPATEWQSPSLPLWYWADTDSRQLQLAHCQHRVLPRGDGLPANEIAILALAANGEVVYETEVARNVDIQGLAMGMAPPPGSPYVSPLSSTLTLLPYLTIHPFGLPTVTTNANGEFTIAGATTASVVAELDGPYFNVTNAAGANAQLIAILNATSQQTLLFNSTPTEFGSAEVAAFQMLGRSYAFLELLSPGFAPAQSPIQATVNFAGNCFASYMPAFGLTFTSSGGGCPNTAYGSVVAHEYFHHIAFQLGGFTAPYDEAMADVFAAFVLDDPEIGRNFYGPLTNLRHLVGTAQFPSPNPSDPAAEGLPLAQAFWDLRVAFQNQLGVATGEQLADELWLGALLVTSGVIDSSIILDLLELDDDDGNLGNGTPHQSLILAAFAGHGFTPPAIPVTGLTCTAVENTLQLSWQLPSNAAFDSLQLHRDGLPIATLAGDSTSTEIVFPQLGDHFYSIIGVTAGTLGPAATCQVQTTTFAPFLRGDMNLDGVLNLIDVIALLQHLLQSVPALACDDAGDVDDSGSLNIADPIYLLNFLFLQLAPPLPPYPAPGLDPTPDDMLCL
ncbi:MAG: dockerin type I repeat-containing protein [Planctomycetota bacterium]